jgi:hypothetical protein
VRLCVCLSNFLCLCPVVRPSVLRVLLPTHRKNQCGFPEKGVKNPWSELGGKADWVERTGVGLTQQADCIRHGDSGGQFGGGGGVFIQDLSYFITKTSQLILFKTIIVYVKVLRNTRTAVAQWLRCCATYRKVAGSIPAGVIGFFIDIKSSKPLTEMSTRNISWVVKVTGA